MVKQSATIAFAASTKACAGFPAASDDWIVRYGRGFSNFRGPFFRPPSGEHRRRFATFAEEYVMSGLKIPLSARLFRPQVCALAQSKDGEIIRSALCREDTTIRDASD